MLGAIAGTLALENPQEFFLPGLLIAFILFLNSMKLCSNRRNRRSKHLIDRQLKQNHHNKKKKHRLFHTISSG